MHKTAYSYSNPQLKYHAPLSQRFPEDIECIIQSPYRDYGSLYISNIEAAENPTTLQHYSIKAVLSCAKGYELNHSKIIVPHYLYIPAVDHQSCDIYPHFDQAVNFIQKHLKTTNVLVHCLAGVSRSVSMVIAYFIRQHNMTDLQAFNLVKSKRKIINPNEGFRQQLKMYHREVISYFKMNQSERSIKKPSKLMTQQYRLYKQISQKHQRTASTNQKSFQEQNKGRYGYVNEGSNRNLLQSYKQSKVKQEEYESFSINKANHTFDQKYASRYLSPQRINRYKQYKEVSIPKQQKNKGYFLPLREDLDQRIEKIKQKYDVQRQKLQQKYQKRNIQNKPFEISFTSNSMIPQNELPNRKGERLKTQSYHQYSNKPVYQTQNERQDEKELYPKIDNLFPRKFRIEQNKTNIEKTASYLDDTFFYRFRTNNFGPQKDGFHHPTTYANLKNSLNRTGYRRFD